MSFARVTCCVCALAATPVLTENILPAADLASVDAAALAANAPLANGVWLEDLDYAKHRGRLSPRRSSKGTPLTIAGKVFPHGLGGTGRAQLIIRLGGKATRFVAAVGIDDVEKSNGSKEFQVWLDDKQVASSGVLRKGQSKVMDVDVRGADRFELIVAHGGIESDWDRFVLGGAQFIGEPGVAADKANWPQPYTPAPEAPPPLASHKDVRLSINGPSVVGGSPLRPFAHRLAVSGKGPARITVTGLPPTIRFDAKSRTLKGTIPRVGRFPISVQARDATSVATATITLVGSFASSAKAMTPIMGWNSWNLWGKSVDASKIRGAAQAMVTSGLADHGYTFVNIDDGWEGKRGADGRITPNAAFGDMAALSSELHAQGLKMGIYSSPGPETCAGFAGSYGYEATDARTYAQWGVDLLKYDWCTYDKVAPDLSPTEQRRPYAVMQTALADVPRDIVYSVCSYGRGEVWTWARQVGASQWRTTSDIDDSWTSLEGIAFAQGDKAPFARPGHVNDPDMLVVGKVGWGQTPRPTHLTANEQILHVTHWAMLAAPLLLGCDLTDLDDFTKDLLMNDEVLAVDQDPLVVPAVRKSVQGRTEVWSRTLADGNTVIALYNRGHVAAEVTANFSDLGLTAPQLVRDVWQRKDVGVVESHHKATVPQHGALMFKLSPAAGKTKPS